ncbi:MAG: hypothetical protein QOD57_4705, partial [Actinomycetota bacterium]|nr:hypothetical protein [Actinomycetota bacterium]
MDIAATTALVARVTLAAAFGFSAVAKLAHRAAFVRGLEQFGVPASG